MTHYKYIVVILCHLKILVRGYNAAKNNSDCGYEWGLRQKNNRPRNGCDNIISLAAASSAEDPARQMGSLLEFPNVIQG